MIGDSLRNREPLISLLNIFYRLLLNGTSKTGMPVLLISILYAVYILHTSFLSPHHSLVYLLFKQEYNLPLYWVIFLCAFGGIGFEEANQVIDKILKYTRVSSRSQENGTSLDRQDKSIQSEIEKLDADIVAEIGGEWESASTMMRKNIDIIIDIVGDSDDTCCLMLKSVDRLTRADPLEACAFLWVLRENDVILYFNDLGYFDLADLNQQLLLMFKFIQSREEYKNIIEEGEAGIIDAKKDDRYPAPAPYGYTKNDAGELEINEAQAEVVKRGAHLFLNGNEDGDIEAGNMQAVKDQLDSEYHDAPVKVPAYTTLLNLYRRDVYTGKITHDGAHLGDCPVIINPDTFQKLQNILDERSTTETDDQLDHALKTVIDRFGTRASLDMFEDIIKGRCPQCGGDVRKWGSVERWGTLVTQYRCENHPKFLDEDKKSLETETCEFEGPLLTDKFLREWESTVPLICSVCQNHLDEDGWTESRTKLNAIEQTCSHCGVSITVDLPENKYERGFKYPDYAISFFEELSKGPSNSSNSGDHPSESGKQDSTSNELNRKLTEFS